MDSPGLCAACRLLQPSRPGEGCRACGAGVIALNGDAARPLLEVIPPQLVLAETAFDQEGTGGKVARGVSLPIIWAGCGVVFGLTLGLALGPWIGLPAWILSSAGATYGWIRPSWRRKPLAWTDRIGARRVETGDLREGRGSWRGPVRACGASVSPFLEGEPAVLAHLLLTRKRGEIILRALRGNEFEVLTAEGARRVAAVDNILLVGPKGERRRADERLQKELGLSWTLTGTAEELLLREGDEVEVFGEITMVPSTSGLGYRAGSEAAVANQSRRPVLVQLVRRAG